MENKKFILIRGAAENNLKHIDLDIPRDELVVLYVILILNLASSFCFLNCISHRVCYRISVHHNMTFAISCCSSNRLNK